MARSSGNNFPFHLKSLYSSYHYGFSFLLMTTRTIFIKTKHLITIVACTGSNNLIEQKYTEQFKWSLNYHFKARSPLFSMVFVQVSLDGLPSDMEKRCRSFWDPFLRETTAFVVLGGTGYDRNQLDSLKQPFKSRTSSDINQQDFTLLELC